MYAKHIPSIHNGYKVRCNGSSSDQFNTVAIDVKVTAKTITSLMESIIFTSVNSYLNS
jgi:hypothetical protein